jgi:hypothetical protein
MLLAFLREYWNWNNLKIYRCRASHYKIEVVFTDFHLSGRISFYLSANPAKLMWDCGICTPVRLGKF